MRPEEFLVSPEELAAMKIQPPEISRKSKLGIKFYPFPTAVVDVLIRANYAPAWALVAAVYKGWYGDFQETKSGQTDFRSFSGVSSFKGPKVKKPEVSGTK